MSVKAPDDQLEQIAIDPHAAAADLILEVERRTGLSSSDYKMLDQGKWPVKFILCEVGVNRLVIYIDTCLQVYPLLSLSDQAVTEHSVLELCHCSVLEELKEPDRKGK